MMSMCTGWAVWPEFEPPCRLWKCSTLLHCESRLLRLWRQRQIIFMRTSLTLTCFNDLILISRMASTSHKNTLLIRLHPLCQTHSLTEQSQAAWNLSVPLKVGINVSFDERIRRSYPSGREIPWGQQSGKPAHLLVCLCPAKLCPVT